VTVRLLVTVVEFDPWPQLDPATAIVNATTPVTPRWITHRIEALFGGGLHDSFPDMAWQRTAQAAANA